MLNQLGINSTSLIQFAIFIITFFALIKLVYEPFAKALLERQKRTLGSAEIADEIGRKSIELHSEYSVKAREIHSVISEIYKVVKAEATNEYDKIISRAREEAKQLIEKNRRANEAEVEKIQKDLEPLKPGIVLAITNKMLGK